MKYKVNVNECYYGVSNDKLMSKIIEANNIHDLLDKIKNDDDLGEYVDFDYYVDNYMQVLKNNENIVHLLLNEVIEFECERLK
tara:strand:+ start:95 stop:343 length:249 start_codon:yes stop_codon:yes gene_type:complete